MDILTGKCSDRFMAHVLKRRVNKYEFPLSPILLALILGPMCEKNFVRYMNIQRGNFFAITTSPIAMVFASVAILVIIYSVYNQSKINKRTAANAAQEKA